MIRLVKTCCCINETTWPNDPRLQRGRLRDQSVELPFSQTCHGLYILSSPANLLQSSSENTGNTGSYKLDICNFNLMPIIQYENRSRRIIKFITFLTKKASNLISSWVWKQLINLWPSVVIYTGNHITEVMFGFHIRFLFLCSSCTQDTFHTILSNFKMWRFLEGKLTL